MKFTGYPKAKTTNLHTIHNHVNGHNLSRRQLDNIQKSLKFPLALTDVAQCDVAQCVALHTPVAQPGVWRFLQGTPAPSCLVTSSFWVLPAEAADVREQKQAAPLWLFRIPDPQNLYTELNDCVSCHTLPYKLKGRPLIPGQDTCLGCRPGPWLGHERSYQFMFLSFSLPSPLSKNK